MLARSLPVGSSRRSVVLGVAGAALVFLFTQVLLPGATGGGRGTPAAVLFTGVTFGMVHALTAAGIILIYRTTRVINFAQTALGAVGAELIFQTLILTRIPFLLILPLGLALAAATGFAFELLLLRRFFNAPRLVLTTATIAGAGLTVVIRQGVNRLPFFPEVRSFDDALGVTPLRNLMPFSGLDFHIGGLPRSFGLPELLALQLPLLVLLLVAVFFRFTRAGVAVRAMAENPERASLLGISTGSLSSIVWTIAGLLSGISVFLAGALDTPAAAGGVAPGVLLPALAAATLGRFKSLPKAAVGAVGIAIVSRAFLYSFRDDIALVNVVLFAIVAVGLILQRPTGGRSEEGSGVAWRATDEQRPVPREFDGVGGLRIARYAMVTVGLVVLGLFPFLVSTGPVNLGGVVALSTILALSVVVLTGWAGQVSLGQWGFASVGAVVSGALTAKVGIPFWFAVPVAAAVSAGMAVLVGIPALRIKGLFLAVTTFMFAFAVNGVLFNRRYFGWMLPGEVARPSLFLIDFEDERSMYFLCIAALVLAVVVVRNLRRSRFGRTLIAVRDNEANVAAVGVAVVRTKLLAFAVSGALAGFAGAIYVVQQRGLNADSYSAQKSLELFLLAIVGGVSSIGGALLGSGVFSASNYFFPTNPIVQVLKPTLVFGLLYSAPGGLIQIVMSMRDAVLRIVAQRRQLIVPSLFADFDPDALARRMIPLGEASIGEGLGSLRADQRFAKASELYQGRGERFVEK
ncbi:MAG: branched-chain amino acid transport system permease protein livM, partial [Actinomycetota bacterium]|nr:branched-chain amino acid transport system permease protein livM [Actinomycetota bacterium]